MTLKEFRSVSAGEKNGPEIFADLYFAEVIDFWFETHRLTLAKPTVYNYKKLFDCNNLKICYIIAGTYKHIIRLFIVQK